MILTQQIKVNKANIDLFTLAKGSDNGFFFQVIEKDTGKVVRQFPPDSLGEMSELDADDFTKSGATVDEAA